MESKDARLIAAATIAASLATTLDSNLDDYEQRIAEMTMEILSRLEKKL